MQNNEYSEALKLLDSQPQSPTSIFNQEEMLFKSHCFFELNSFNKSLNCLN